jgi:uncharacterized protein (DUF2147 family)
VADAAVEPSAAGFEAAAPATSKAETIDSMKREHDVMRLDRIVLQQLGTKMAARGFILRGQELAPRVRVSAARFGASPQGLSARSRGEKKPGSVSMKSYHLRTGLIALATFSILDAAPALANVEGVWLVKDGSTMRIRNCGDGVCGYIASNAPTPADSSQANRSMIGVQVLSSMRQVSPGKWTGRLYNPKDGNTYTGNLIEIGPDAIRIEGCMFGICGGQDLVRTRSSVSSARGEALRSR